MKKLIILALALLSCACTIVQHPSKRPVSAEYQEKFNSVAVTLEENPYGVGASWFRQDSSAVGAQYGLLGGLVTGIMDAIANAGPAARAEKSAVEIGEVLTPEYLNSSLVSAMESQQNSDDLTVSIETVGSIQPFGKDVLPGKLKLSIEYQLSENAAAIQVQAIASYTDNNLIFKTPYRDDKGKAPKVTNANLVYLNTFTYESDRFVMPEYTSDLENELIEKIKERYTDENGKLPVAKTDDFKKMEKELKDAKDGKLSKSEASIFLIRKWIENDGEIAFAEIQKAHEFIAKHVLMDLTRTEVPSMNGSDQILETLVDGRIVRIVGKGVDSGSIVSSPGQLDSFITYGNAVAYPKKNLEKVNQIKKENKNSRS